MVDRWIPRQRLIRPDSCKLPTQQQQLPPREWDEQTPKNNLLGETVPQTKGTQSHGNTENRSHRCRLLHFSSHYCEMGRTGRQGLCSRAGVSVEASKEQEQERERERGRSFCAQMTGRQDKIYLRSGKTGLVQYGSGGYPFVS